MSSGDLVLHTVTMLPTLLILALAQCPADVDIPPVATGGFTGASVAIDGEVAVIGAPLGTGNDWATGVVLVYRNIDGTWTREAELAANDGLVGNMMGISVDISGDRVVAGAWFEDSLGTDSGAAYVFVHANGSWTQEAKLKAADPGANDTFGRTVAIGGSTIVVGAPLDDDQGPSTGSAYVFEHGSSGWSQVQKLLGTPALGGDQFSLGLDLNGDDLAIGAPWADKGTGLVHVFKRSKGNFQQIASLSDDTGSAQDFFGFELAIDHQRVVIGAYSDDDAGPDAGRVIVFEEQSGAWTPVQELLPEGDDINEDQFGVSVALDGEQLLIGSRFGGVGEGAATSYLLLDDNTWVRNHHIVPPDPQLEAEFGWAVAIDGDRALIGELEADPDGMAHFFDGMLEACGCQGDINGDQFVDVNDLLAVIGGWGDPYDVSDLLAVIAGWGACE